VAHASIGVVYRQLIEAARLIHDARHPRYPGLKRAEIGLDFRKLIEQKNEVIYGYRKRKYESLIGDKITIEHGHARFVDDRMIEVDGKRLSGDKILIATGSRPVIPTIAGLDEVPYITSDLLTKDEPQELTELPRSLIIVGGGYIPLELGQMFRRM
jgi:mercuric reductase